MEEPTRLVTTILQDIKSSGQRKSRYVLRLVPVLATCKAHLDNIKKATQAVLAQYSECPEEGTRYLIVPRVRHNDQLKNAPLTGEILQLVKEAKPHWVPELKEPQVVLMIDVLHKVGCVSLMKDYFDYKKYNIHALSSSNPDEPANKKCRLETPD